METKREFAARRERLIELMSRRAGRPTKRFLALDREVYEAGALPAKVKELLGLVASAVLRCDDCIRYHIERAVEAGASEEEIDEALAVALVVGGSITLPHLRRACECLEALKAEN